MAACRLPRRERPKRRSRRESAFGEIASYSPRCGTGNVPCSPPLVHAAAWLWSARAASQRALHGRRPTAAHGTSSSSHCARGATWLPPPSRPNCGVGDADVHGKLAALRAAQPRDELAQASLRAVRARHEPQRCAHDLGARARVAAQVEPVGHELAERRGQELVSRHRGGGGHRRIIPARASSRWPGLPVDPGARGGIRPAGPLGPRPRRITERSRQRRSRHRSSRPA